MGEMTTIKGPQGEFSAYCVYPEEESAPGLVLLQEIFGINSFMREAADAWAARGFMVMVPDLFWRIQPGVQLDSRKEDEFKQGLALLERFDRDAAEKDIQTAIADLASQEGCSGKVGTLGYCLGGHLAYRAALSTVADASVGYYGVGLEALAAQGRPLKCPLMLHVAEEDSFSSDDARKALIDAVSGDPKVTLHLYPGMEHAFARPGSHHYDAEAARLADDRSEAFLKANL